MLRTEVSNLMIMNALITVVTSLLGPVVRRLPRFVRMRLQSSRRELAGTWTGTAIEKFLEVEVDEVWLSSTLTIHLQQDAEAFKGILDARSSNGQNYQMNLEGRLEDAHYLTMTVRSSVPKEVNFGVLLLKLDAKGKQLHGYALMSVLDHPRVSLAIVELVAE
jgi:hypothetical protein